MLLVVGLGNPGREYEGTRHNVGFLFIDDIASDAGAGPQQNRFQSVVQKGRLNGNDIVFLKPQTFMNLSGTAVLECMQFFKITAQDIIVVFDDLTKNLAQFERDLAEDMEATTECETYWHALGPISFIA